MLFSLWMLATILAWFYLLQRVNAQIRRYRDDPTPRTRFDQLREDVDLQDDRVKRNRRSCLDLEAAVDDAYDRIKRLNNKYAANRRQDEKVDLMEAAKVSLQQLASQQENGSGDESGLEDSEFPAGLDPSGQPFDFR